MEHPPPLHNEPTIPFSEIYTLLSTFHQSTSALNLPLTHPITHRLLDILTSLNIEQLLQHRWTENYTKLKEYKATHGNCEVKDDDDLHTWVSLQRECYRNYEQRQVNRQQLEQVEDGERIPSLSTERYLKLKNVGLTVNKWEKRLMELRRHKMETGHCDVAIDYPGGLGIWCATQRETYKFESMPKERIEALDAIGFSWSRWGRQRSKARKDAWDKMFHELIEYKNANGDCNISQYDENNKQLGKWAKNQRYEYRRYHNKGLGQSRISRDRIDKLESIGFQWRLKPEKVSWDERFEMLKQYKEENGHCRPPQNHPEIGSWAKYQRNQMQYFLEGKVSKIDQEKADKLIQIGLNDPPTSRADRTDAVLDLEHHEFVDSQAKKRARRMARLRKNSEQPQQQQQQLQHHLHQTPHQTHHPHHSFQHYPEQNIQHYPAPPQYEFDPNASLDNFYQAYDQHGAPILHDGNTSVVYYQQGYDQQLYGDARENSNL